MSEGLQAHIQQDTVVASDLDVGGSTGGRSVDHHRGLDNSGALKGDQQTPGTEWGQVLVAVSVLDTIDDHLRQWSLSHQALSVPDPGDLQELVDDQLWPAAIDEIAAGQMEMNRAIELSGDLAEFIEVVEASSRQDVPLNGIVGDIYTARQLDAAEMMQRMLNGATQDLENLRC